MEKVTIEEYGQAVVRLLPVAQSDTGQSRVCAQVLLSAYNGNSFQLDVSDLCNLDGNLYEDCVTVIRGRVDCRREPHSLVEGGGKMFERLHDSWLNLKLSNRAKESCWDCNGNGKIYDDDYDEDKSRPCRTCDGRGWSWPRED